MEAWMETVPGSPDAEARAQERQRQEAAAAMAIDMIALIAFP
jgi:hypothetical protein